MAVLWRLERRRLHSLVACCCRVVLTSPLCFLRKHPPSTLLMVHATHPSPAGWLWSAAAAATHPIPPLSIHPDGQRACPRLLEIACVFVCLFATCSNLAARRRGLMLSLLSLLRHCTLCLIHIHPFIISCAPGLCVCAPSACDTVLPGPGCTTLCTVFSVLLACVTC